MRDRRVSLPIAVRWLAIIPVCSTLMLALPLLAGEPGVASGNGLRVALLPDGSVSRVEINSRRVDGGRSGGFFLRIGGAEETPRATVEADGKSARLKLDWPKSGIAGTAAMTGEASSIAVHGEIVDSSGKDRAVTISFELPVGSEAATKWWDDIDRSRPAAGSAALENVVKTPAGATGTHSPYPLACVSGSSAVALGIPLDRPVLHRFAYSPSTGRLGVSFDFALTPAARRLPSKASFDFVIYPADPVWGFRSALERYYAIYPAFFERRMPKTGGWVAWGNLESVPNFADYGFQFHWGPDQTGVAFDGAHGIYTFLYSDSARFFSDLGVFDKKPDNEQATRAFRELMESADPRGVVLGRPTSATGRVRLETLQREVGPEKAGEWFRKAVAAIRISATTNAKGEFNVGYILNRKDWGPPNWWTGRLFCNMDPAIPGGYGEFLLNDILGRSFPSVRTAGGSYNGVALDNYFVDADTLDFRAEHVAVSEIPLTFSHEGLRPAVLGDFALFRWVSELSRRLRPQGGWVMANAVFATYPFAASVVDIPGYEWNVMDVAPLVRALAYRKPVVSLPVKEEHYQEAFIRKHVRFGLVPGGYADKRFATDTALRALYKRYIPALLKCAEAGWEPVTGAVSDNAAIKVERFGRPGSRVFLSISNATGTAQAGRIRLDTGKLALAAGSLGTADLIGGKVVQWTPEKDAMVASLQLAAEEALVLELAK